MGRPVRVIVVFLFAIINIIKCEQYPDFMSDQQLYETFGKGGFNRDHPYRRTTGPPEEHHMYMDMGNAEDPVYTHGRKPPNDENLDIPGAPPRQRLPGRAGPISTIPPNMDENRYLSMLMLQPMMQRTKVASTTPLAIYYLIPGTNIELTYRPTHVQNSSPKDTYFKSSNSPTQLKLYLPNRPEMRSINKEEIAPKTQILNTYASDSADIIKSTGSFSNNGPPMIEMRAQIPLNQLTDAISHIPHTLWQQIDSPVHYSFAQEQFKPEIEENKEKLNHIPVFRSEIETSNNEATNKNDQNHKDITDFDFKSLLRADTTFSKPIYETHKTEFNEMPIKNVLESQLEEENAKYSRESMQDRSEINLNDDLKPDEDVKFEDLMIKPTWASTTEATTSLSTQARETYSNQGYVTPVKDSVISY